jgi:hypothetical protein
MTKILLSFFIVFSSFGFSQVTKIKVEKEKPEIKKLPPRGMLSIDLCYGYLAYQDDFYKQLNTGENLNFNLPPQVVGIGVSGYEVLIGPTYILYQIDAQKYLPQFVAIHDTIQATYSGARFGMGLGKRFANTNESLSLACYLGFNSGRSTLKNSEFISVQKAFFCPKISIQPKVILKNVALSITITAQGDVTNLKWNQTYSNGNMKVPLANHSQTSISAVVGIGYRIGYW